MGQPQGIELVDTMQRPEPLGLEAAGRGGRQRRQAEALAEVAGRDTARGGRQRRQAEAQAAGGVRQAAGSRGEVQAEAAGGWRRAAGGWRRATGGGRRAALAETWLGSSDDLFGYLSAMQIGWASRAIGNDQIGYRGLSAMTTNWVSRSVTFCSGRCNAVLAGVNWLAPDTNAHNSSHGLR